jgi:hypothetical protein
MITSLLVYLLIGGLFFIVSARPYAAGRRPSVTIVFALFVLLVWPLKVATWCGFLLDAFQKRWGRAR